MPVRYLFSNDLLNRCNEMKFLVDETLHLWLNRGMKSALCAVILLCSLFSMAYADPGDIRIYTVEPAFIILLPEKPFPPGVDAMRASVDAVFDMNANPITQIQKMCPNSHGAKFLARIPIAIFQRGKVVPAWVFSVICFRFKR